MLGVFTTTKYDSRTAYEAGREDDVIVSTNRFTNVGLEWMWRMMAGLLRDGEGKVTDHLSAARLLVGNSSQEFDPSDTRLAGDLTAQAQLTEGYPVIEGPIMLPSDDVVPNGWRIRFSALFGEDQAIFDWQERGVVTAQGVLLDRSVMDQGRKVLGAVWQLDAELTLGR